MIFGSRLSLEFTSFHQIASEGLKHRVFEISLADLQNDEDHAYRKIRLRAEDVQGKNVLTNFWVRQCINDCFCPFTIKYAYWILTVYLFRGWTSLQTSWDLLLGNGSLWSRLMLMWRLQTVTLWGCSALALPRNVLTRWRGLAMHNPAKSVRYYLLRYYIILALTLLSYN